MKINRINNFNIYGKNHLKNFKKDNFSSNNYTDENSLRAYSNLPIIYFLGNKKSGRESYSNKSFLKEEEKFFDNFEPIEGLENYENFIIFLSKKEPLKRQEFEAMDKIKQVDYFNIANELFANKKDIYKAISPNIVAKCSFKLKEYFDKTYGENNYRIISLGTSPYTIAKGMEFLGCETIYLPFSNTRGVGDKTHYTKEDIKESYKDYKNAQIAMNYLRYKGVGRNNDKKINIVIDYCHYGKTLCTATKFIEEMLNENKKLFKHKPKVVGCNIVNAIKDTNRRNGIINNDECHQISTSMKCANIEYISGVPHFDIRNENSFYTSQYVYSQNKSNKEIFKEFENYSTKISKLYSICLLEEIIGIENNYKK